MDVLLSIKPKYTELDVERMFIYESYPSKNIVGWFSIKRILSGSPEDIWKKCKDLSGIEKEQYFIYTRGKRVIYAFEINEIFQFDIPIDPFNSIPNFRPPQNFTYFSHHIVSKILGHNREDINV